VAVATLPPFLLAGVRSVIAGSILVAIGMARGESRPKRPQVIAAVLAGAMFFLVGHGGLFWAEQRVESGPAALMTATEHFSRRRAAGRAAHLAHRGGRDRDHLGRGADHRRHGIAHAGLIVRSDAGAGAATAGGRRSAPPIHIHREGTIARVWRGETRAGDGDACARYLAWTGEPDDCSAEAICRLTLRSSGRTRR
jgi:hypothetical protein